MKPAKPGLTELGSILGRGLPRSVVRRLPPSSLLRVWEESVGDYLARQCRPVCFAEDGSLLVAVKGAALRQEISLLAPDILAKLADKGWALPGLRSVAAKSGPPSVPPYPTLSPLPAEVQKQIQTLVRDVQDKELRDKLRRLMELSLQVQRLDK